MEKTSPPEHDSQEERGQSARHLPEEVFRRAPEPERLGGEPPCYAHLLDEDDPDQDVR